MKSRPVAVQGAVAVLALALAALVWLSPTAPRRPNEVPVVGFRPGEVNAVRFDDGAHRVEVVRAVSGEPGVWLRIGRSPSLAAPDAGTLIAGRDGGSGRVDSGRPDAGTARGRPDGGPGSRDGGLLAQLESLPPPPDRELRGNEVAEKILDRVSPLLAVRALGTASPARRQEMGLEAPAKSLQLDGRTGTVRFGVSTPPGASGTYLLGEDGRVWIIADGLVQDLVSANSRLVDRRLHAFRPEDADSVAIQAEGRGRRYVVRKVQGAVRLAPEESPDSPDTAASLVADRLWRLPPTEVLGRGETPREGSPLPALRVDYLRNRRPMGFLELARAGTDLFARSEHTVSWVRLPAPSASALSEADRLLSGGNEHPAR